MGEREGYRPSEAEIRNTNEEAPSVGAGEQELSTQLAPEVAIERWIRELSGRFGAPEAKGAIENVEEGERALRSQLDVAMERAGEAGPEEIAEREARTREQGEARERRIQEFADDLLRQRMEGTISYAAVDAMLAENKIQPWTDGAARFMESWDRTQAAAAYEQTLARFDNEIVSAQMEIEELGKQIKETNYKGKIAKLEGAMLAREARIKELREKKDAFAFVQTPEVQIEPEAPVSAPEPVPKSAGAAAVRDFEPTSPAEPAVEALAEDLVLAKGKIIEIELPAPERGATVRILKKRLLRDKYYVEELNEDGTARGRYDVSGELLRQGTEVEEGRDEDSSEGESSGDSGKEERLAA